MDQGATSLQQLQGEQAVLHLLGQLMSASLVGFALPAPMGLLQTHGPSLMCPAQERVTLSASDSHLVLCLVCTFGCTSISLFRKQPSVSL